ncbi:MAG: hypothetical protein JWO42_3843 [Chloroflexi bacterium]|nr:hypothetical protein [Chloroflexota bacterium]
MCRARRENALAQATRAALPSSPTDLHGESSPRSRRRDHARSGPAVGCPADEGAPHKCSVPQTDGGTRDRRKLSSGRRRFCGRGRQCSACRGRGCRRIRFRCFRCRGIGSRRSRRGGRARVAAGGSRDVEHKIPGIGRTPTTRVVPARRRVE